MEFQNASQAVVICNMPHYVVYGKARRKWQVLLDVCVDCRRRGLLIRGTLF